MTCSKLRDSQVRLIEKAQTRKLNGRKLCRAGAAGKGHKLKMPGSQKIFQNFCKIPFSNRFKRFYPHLELPIFSFQVCLRDIFSESFNPP